MSGSSRRIANSVRTLGTRSIDSSCQHRAWIRDQQELREREETKDLASWHRRPGRAPKPKAAPPASPWDAEGRIVLPSAHSPRPDPDPAPARRVVRKPRLPLIASTPVCPPPECVTATKTSRGSFRRFLDRQTRSSATRGAKIQSARPRVASVMDPRSVLLSRRAETRRRSRVSSRTESVPDAAPPRAALPRRARGEVGAAAPEHRGGAG